MKETSSFEDGGVWPAAQPIRKKVDRELPDSEGLIRVAREMNRSEHRSVWYPADLLSLSWEALAFTLRALFSHFMPYTVVATCVVREEGAT